MPMSRSLYLSGGLLAFVIAVLLAFELVAHAGEASAVSYGRVPAGAYSVVAQVRARPGKEAELRSITVPLIAKVRAENGNLVYFLQENRESPGHFIFYEVFTTKETFEAHNHSAHVQEWFGKLPALTQGGVEVMRMEILASPIS
jgi:quinol monooxygenase YgiN